MSQSQNGSFATNNATPLGEDAQEGGTGVKTLEASDAFQARAEPLIPPPARDLTKSHGKTPGAGRERKDTQRAGMGVREMEA